MTYDANKDRALNEVWASPSNRPAPSRNRVLMEDLMKRIEDEQKWVNRVTAIAGFALSILTLRILYDAALSPELFDLRKEWAAPALLGLSWIAFFVLWFRMSSSRQAAPDADQTLFATLTAALRDNAKARWRIVFLGLALAAGAALTGVALVQLIETGKMTERNAWQGGLLFGGVLGAICVLMAFHYFRVLRPEARRLETLLADSDD